MILPTVMFLSAWAGAASAGAGPWPWPQLPCRDTSDAKTAEGMWAGQDEPGPPPVANVYQGDPRKDAVEVWRVVNRVAAPGGTGVETALHVGGASDAEVIIYGKPEEPGKAVIHLTDKLFARVRTKNELACVLAHADSHILRKHHARNWAYGERLIDSWIRDHGHRYIDGPLSLDTLEDDLAQAVCPGYTEYVKSAEAKAEADALRLSAIALALPPAEAAKACAGGSSPRDLRWLVLREDMSSPAARSAMLRRRGARQ